MSQHTVTTSWHRGDAAFTDNRYSRVHRWQFDGGLGVTASASPHIVRPPLSDPAAIDPEEAFVASLSSCHLLWFLSTAAAAGWVVDSYADEAVGVLARDEAGRDAITVVTLHPRVVYRERMPTPAEHRELHEQAHHRCFLANSVRSEIRCEPTAVLA